MNKLFKCMGGEKDREKAAELSVECAMMLGAMHGSKSSKVCFAIYDI